MRTVPFHQQIDLRGEQCPYGFVRVQLALDEMEPRQVLQVLLDHPPAAVQVPRTVRNGGDEVLAVQQATATDWVIMLRKAAPANQAYSRRL